MRVIAAACKLCDPGNGERPAREFEHQVVSAFGEAFNNVALHGFVGVGEGEIEIEIDVGGDAMTIRMKDYGVGFDPSSVPKPDLGTLPESGLGLFIIKSFMDEVHYQTGAPNVLTMTKRVGHSERSDE
jgi:serine/threonine-protein kinase RsbW